MRTTSGTLASWSTGVGGGVEQPSVKMTTKDKTPSVAIPFLGRMILQSHTTARTHVCVLVHSRNERPRSEKRRRERRGRGGRGRERRTGTDAATGAATADGYGCGDSNGSDSSDSFSTNDCSLARSARPSMQTAEVSPASGSAQPMGRPRRSPADEPLGARTRRQRAQTAVRLRRQ